MNDPQSDMQLGDYDFDDLITTYVTQGLLACLSHEFEEAADWFSKACHGGIDHRDNNAILITALLTAYAQEENDADIEGAIRSIDLAQKVAEESHLVECILKLHLWRGRLHVANGEPDLAWKSCNKAADFALQRGNSDLAEDFISIGDRWKDLASRETEDTNEEI